MAKGGATEQKVRLDPEIKAAALKNLGVAGNVSALPYTPNFGLSMAAFTPEQNASFANTNSAASAFGLPGGDAGTGMPAPKDVGGFKGYSTEQLYNDALSRVKPQVRDLYNAFFTPQGREALGADPINTLLNRPASKSDATSSRTPVKSVTMPKTPQFFASDWITDPATGQARYRWGS